MTRSARSEREKSTRAGARAGAPGKTERTHEENQERAYIAASRRTDRSLEARVQSARMASDIHKKRTGKGFIISEQIVLNQDMYEEESDGLPRSYQLLSADMATSTASANSRLETFVASKVAMADMLAKADNEWRENRINKLFSESFGAISNSTLPPQPPQPAQPPQQQPQHPMYHYQIQQAPAAMLGTTNAARQITGHQIGDGSSLAADHSHHAAHTSQQRAGQNPAFAIAASGAPQSIPSAFEHNDSSSQYGYLQGYNALASDFPAEVRMMMDDAAVQDQLNAWTMEGRVDQSHNGKLDDGSTGKAADQTLEDMVDIHAMNSNDSWATFIDESAAQSEDFKH